MRKIMAVFTVAATLIITPLVMAEELKVPKLLCVDMDLYLDKHQLALQSNGPIYDPDGNVKTYTITGRDRYGTISGSGYVEPGTTILYATYSGMHLVLPRMAAECVDNESSPCVGEAEGPVTQIATYFLQIDLEKTDKAGKMEFIFTYPDWQGDEPIISNSDTRSETTLDRPADRTPPHNILSFSNNTGSDIIKCDTLDASFLPVIQGSAAADAGQRYNKVIFPPL